MKWWRRWSGSAWTTIFISALSTYRYDANYAAEGFVHVMVANGLFKIGVTQNVRKRRSSVQIHNPHRAGRMVE
jgi:hypothetical protein